jgi:hypothetical protein
MLHREKHGKHKGHSLDIYLDIPFPIHSVGGQIRDSHIVEHSRATIEYFVNKQGYRSEDFDNLVSKDTIYVGGCSVTFGLGLEENVRWSTLLKDKLSAKYLADVSAPGNSCSRIFQDVYKYINRYGKPKIVMLLLPNVSRYYSIDIDNGRLTTAPYSLEVFVPSTEQPLENQEELDIVNSVITNKNLMSDFMNEAKQLEMYLEAVGVPLMYTTWDPGFEHELNKTKRLNSYFSYRKKYGEAYFGDKFEDPEPGQEEFWLFAADGIGADAHPGILDHMSYADAFHQEAIAKFGDEFFA